MLWKIRVLTRNIRIPTLLLLLGGTALVAPHSVTQQQICELGKLCDTAATVQLCNCTHSVTQQQLCKLGMQEAGQGGEAESDKMIIEDLLRI